MCIGIPLRVIASHDFHAVCDDAGQPRTVDTTLIGRAEVGDWLLVFLGSAREVLDVDTAHKMRDALAAMERVMAGDHQVEHLFADLVEREPSLPAHLQHLPQAKKP